MGIQNQRTLEFNSLSAAPVISLDETALHELIITCEAKLPSHNEEVLPGIKWGDHNQLFTPAYWKVQYHLHEVDNRFMINYKLGSSLIEEVVACLLGGFGLKAEIGLAAFERLKEQKAIKPKCDFTTLLDLLTQPFLVNGRSVHYRFPNQKAKFIFQFLNRSDLETNDHLSDKHLRDWLLTINGIGPKTASWITRNFKDSERVAIIDIHIFRACVAMGLFPSRARIEHDYFELEKMFLTFCNRIGVKPSRLDSLMWLQMKDFYAR